MYAKIFKIVLAPILFLVASCQTQNVLWQGGHETGNKSAYLDSCFFFDPEYQYRIRENDKISISVWGQDELSVGSLYGIYNSNEVYGKWLMVDAEGNIEVPKIGTLHVEGYSIIELKKQLKNRFGTWVANPIVDVKVLNKEITVLGEVKDPQVVHVDGDSNPLIKIISRCNGFDFHANLKHIKVIRQYGEDVHVANLDISGMNNYLLQNIQLYPGDVVLVPARKFKVFDRRITTIIPFTTTITAAAILMSAL